MGGVFAILVSLIVGAGQRTDGFLAAYSAYTIFLLFGTTMRITLVPQFGSTAEPQRFNDNAVERIGAIVPVAAALCALFVLGAPAIGAALMSGSGGVARTAATEAVAILGAAAFCQIWAAVLASVLSGARRFIAATVFYLVSAASMVVVGAALMPLIDTTGAAIAVLVAAVVLVGTHIVYLGRFGFRAPPRWRAVASRKAWVFTALAASGSFLTMALQLNLTISLALVSSSIGVVTAYVYAYMAAVTVTSVTAATIGLVTMPNLIDAHEQHGHQAVRGYLGDTAAFGMFLYAPLAVGYVLFGYPVADAVFANALSPETLSFFWDASRVLMAMGVIWVIYTPLITLALMLKLYQRIVVTALLTVLVHVALVAPLSTVSPRAVVIGQAISGSVLMVILAVAVLGRSAARDTWAMFAAVTPCFVPLFGFVAVRLVTGAPTSLPESLAALAAASIFYLAAAIKLWPSVGGRAVQLLLSRSPG